MRPCPQARIPERIVEKAIVGMLPKNAHGRKLFSHHKVYKGPVCAAPPRSACTPSLLLTTLLACCAQEHPHDAQQPQPLTFGGLTSSPDTRLLEFIDPDAPKCVN